MGGADEVRAGRVERYISAIGRMSRSVRMGALRVVWGDCERSSVRIERMNASLAVAGGKPARISQVAVVNLR